MLSFYPEKTLQKLDFPFIIQELMNRCSGSLGRNLVEKQYFITDVEVLKEALFYTREMKDILENDVALPHSGFNELSFLDKLKIDNYYLEINELIELYFSLTSIADVFRYFSPKARQQLYPCLYNKVSAFFFDVEIIISIAKIIDVDKEEIKDNATPALSKIRKQIQYKNQEISAAFRRALAHYKLQNCLAETEETIRDGRRVLSVKAEYKRSIKGLIVDESDSGNITYIEPNETIFLNNELTDLFFEERRELIKILREITAVIQPHRENISLLQLLMGEIDFIRAKAYFAMYFNCSLPQISLEPQIYLREFVHPVLYHYHKKQHKPIIDNTILLDEKNRIILISGPNAGGKSIVLKSVGLIQLMFQFGMLIPAKETSSLCVFQHLFVDIGDEQSIENDLSTYSSHLSNMNFFLKNANEKTLILIDEMGMGTDPALGGPMAEAIVEQLHKEKVFGVITTHFNNLKIFAANTDNMLSGAMSFDTKQLKPLYQLQMGQPGSSFTFEIAKKSGLHEQIIKNATAKIGGNKKALDDVLTDIQTEKQFIKGLRKNVQAKESQLQDLTKSYEQLNIDLDKEKRKLLKQYEARLLDRFNAESRNLENEMRTWKEQKNNKEKFLDVRNFIDVHRENIEIKLSEERTNSKPVSNRIFKIGDTVKLEDSSQIGKVLDVKNGIATVTFGFIQSKMKLNKLILVQDNKPKIETKINSYTSKMIIEKSEFDQQLDLRGMLKEEAIIALDIFMDKAIMYGMHQIKIIHGRGTGALKQAVQSFLKSYPHVKNYKFEIEQFGGDGITLVELK